MQLTVTQLAKNAKAAYIWKKLAAFSDFAWHPEFKESKNIGDIQDGSPNMVGATRLLVNHEGGELKEVVTAWSDENRSMSFTIEGNALPAPIQTFLFTFEVREDNDQVFVDAIADVEIKWFFILFTPLLSLKLKQKAQSLVDGIADLKDE